MLHEACRPRGAELVACAPHASPDPRGLLPAAHAPWTALRAAGGRGGHARGSFCPSHHVLPRAWESSTVRRPPGSGTFDRGVVTGRGLLPASPFQRFHTEGFIVSPDVHVPWWGLFVFLVPKQASPSLPVYLPVSLCAGRGAKSRPGVSGSAGSQGIKLSASLAGILSDGRGTRAQMSRPGQKPF